MLFYDLKLNVFVFVGSLAEAKDVLHETLVRWRYDGFALVHYGFVLKNFDKNLEHAAMYLQEGIDTEAEGTSDGRFYFHLGDALTKLGRKDEAMEVSYHFSSFSMSSKFVCFS